MKIDEKTAELNIHVEIETSHHGLSRPRRFQLGSHWVEVSEVIDCWQGADLRYFKVRTDDSHVYILKQAFENAVWSLTLFSREEYWKGQNDATYHPRAYLL